MWERSEYVTAATAALVISHPSGGVYIGSATGIHLGNRFLLATAAHNINNFHQYSRLQVVDPGNREITVISRSHPRSEEFPHDVAWLEVEPAEVAASVMEWLNLRDLLCGQKFDPGCEFLVQGYPMEGIRFPYPGAFDFLSLGMNCIPLPPDPDNNDELVLEVALGPHEGLADGGGVWSIPFFAESSTVLPEMARLVAIARSYDSEQSRLYSAPIEEWLTLVASDFPELQEEVKAAIREYQQVTPVLVSPNFSYEKLQNPSIDDLVDVFNDRMKSCLLGPVKRLVGDRVANIAGLSLLLTYFEGIWIYIQGQDSKGRSREFFEAAFVEVFRSSGLNDSILKRIAGLFCEGMCCGFLHDGIFRERIFFAKLPAGVMQVTLPKIDGYIDEAGEIQSMIIDVEEFYQCVESHFDQLVARLRNSGQIELRSNFIKTCHQRWSY